MKKKNVIRELLREPHWFDSLIRFDTVNKAGLSTKKSEGKKRRKSVRG